METSNIPTFMISVRYVDVEFGIERNCLHSDNKYMITLG